MLDAAGIKRAIVVSNAYYFDSTVTDTSGTDDRATRVRTENDWTAQQVAQFPERLIGYCSLNPLADYSRGELDRCAHTPAFKGLKLHLGGLGVGLMEPGDVELVRGIVRAANRHRLPIIIHVRADQSYGSAHAEVLLNQILPAAPDVAVQIAHLWGGESFSESALTTFANALSSGDPATKNLYFDRAEVARVLKGRSDMLQKVAVLIRRIEVERILYGSDAPVFGNSEPKEARAALLQEVPLTTDEFDAIANNALPSLR